MKKLAILIAFAISIFPLFGVEGSTGFGIVWNYSNSNSFVPVTTITILNEAESEYSATSIDGVLTVDNPISVSGSDNEQFAFTLKYSTNVSGRHILSYRATPMESESGNDWSGYVLRYELNNSTPSITTGGLLTVGNDGAKTYPENGSFSTSFVLPTLADPESLYNLFIKFYVTLSTEMMSVGTNTSTIVITEEAL